MAIGNIDLIEYMFVQALWNVGTTYGIAVQSIPQRVQEQGVVGRRPGIYLKIVSYTGGPPRVMQGNPAAEREYTLDMNLFKDIYADSSAGLNTIIDEIEAVLQGAYFLPGQPIYVEQSQFLNRTPDGLWWQQFAWAVPLEHPVNINCLRLTLPDGTVILPVEPAPPLPGEYLFKTWLLL